MCLTNKSSIQEGRKIKRKNLEGAHPRSSSRKEKISIKKVWRQGF
jgi:hypothetical protein